MGGPPCLRPSSWGVEPGDMKAVFLLLAPLTCNRHNCQDFILDIRNSSLLLHSLKTGSEALGAMSPKGSPYVRRFPCEELFSEFLPHLCQTPENIMYFLALKPHFCNYSYLGIYFKEIYKFS